MAEQEKIARCVQSGPLSAGGMYMLYVAGSWGEKEARNLIRVLELQVQWLGEDVADGENAPKEKT